MERPDHGRGRGQASGEKSALRVDWRTVCGGRAVHGDQRGDSVYSARGADCRFSRPAVAALSVVAGPAGAALVAAGMALSIFVTLNGTVMSGARIPFAAARDGLFFPKFARIQPGSRVPLIRWSFRGCFRRFCCSRWAASSSFLNWRCLPNGSFTCSRRRPCSSTAESIRTWLDPTGSGVIQCCLRCSSCLRGSADFKLAGNLKGSLIGSGLILLGLPLYEWIRRKYQPLPC